MQKLTCDDLCRLRADYVATFDSIKAACEATVVERRLATDRMISPQPHFDQIQDRIQRWEPPKRWWIEDGDETALSPVSHGFDAEGRLRTLGDRTVVLYGDGYVDELIRVGRGKSASVSFVRYVLSPAGDSEAIYSCTDQGEWCSVETFQRENGRVVTSEVRRCESEEDLWGDDALSVRRRYEWEGDRISSVLEESGLKLSATRWHVLFAAGPGDTLESASDRLEEALVENVLSRAKAAADESDPLVLAAICYCGEDIPAGYPGDVAIVRKSGFESLVESGEEGAFTLWMPPEWSAETVVQGLSAPNDLQVEEAGLRLLQIVDGPTVFLEGETILPLREVLQRAARALNELDWSQIAPTTDSFVVAPIDDTGECDLLEDLEASVPPERLAALVEKGLLPDPDTMDDEDDGEDEDDDE